MKKCSGNNTREWGFDAIFDVLCPHCGQAVEFFKDDVTRICRHCKHAVENDRKDFGCNLWCSSSSPHWRNRCPNFRRSKDRFYGIY